MVMHRRYTGAHLERRHMRGPRASPGGDTYQSILGALLVEMWHSQLGIATVSGNVDTWTGQVGGRVLQAPSAGRRMLYASNGAFSSGKSMPHAVAGSSSCVVGSGLTTLFLAATRPWVIAVFRVSAFSGATQTWFSVDDGAGNAGPFLFSSAAGTSMNALSGASLAFSDTASAHVFEQGLASPSEYVGVDGGYGTVASGALIGGARSKVCIGMNGGTVQPSSAAWALLLACSARPTSAQVAAVTVLVKSEFGF